MADIMSKEQRSRHMGLVRGRNTQFELEFLRMLSGSVYPLGYRYRKHHRGVFGTPDVAFVRYRVAVFLDSDFWHGRNYDPSSSKMNAFWRAKIERNIARDIEVDRQLRQENWNVLRFGEKEVKKTPEEAIRAILAALPTRMPR